MENTAQLLKQVVDQYPKLSRYGFQHPDYEMQNKETFSAGRKAMLHDIAAFDYSREYLSFLTPSRGYNTEYTAHFLRERAQEYYQKRSDPQLYIPDGVFIAAALALGFKVRQVDDKAAINVKLQHGANETGVRSGNFWLMSPLA
jgi:hypothetical protein